MIEPTDVRKGTQVKSSSGERGSLTGGKDYERGTQFMPKVGVVWDNEEEVSWVYPTELSLI